MRIKTTTLKNKKKSLIVRGKGKLNYLHVWIKKKINYNYKSNNPATMSQHVINSEKNPGIYSQPWGVHRPAPWTITPDPPIYYISTAINIRKVALFGFTAERKGEEKQFKTKHRKISGQKVVCIWLDENIEIRKIPPESSRFFIVFLNVITVILLIHWPNGHISPI